MNGERSYTTKIWPQPSWIESWSADGSFTSMGLRGGPAISNWKRPCFRRQNGSEFPELAAQNFRNPQKPRPLRPQSSGGLRSSFLTRQRCSERVNRDWNGSLFESLLSKLK